MFLSEDEVRKVRADKARFDQMWGANAPYLERVFCDAKTAKIAEGIREVREMKRKYPFLKSGVNKSQVGSILNAYREGDLTFDECCQLLEAKQKESCIEF